MGWLEFQNSAAKSEVTFLFIAYYPSVHCILSLSAIEGCSLVYFLPSYSFSLLFPSFPHTSILICLKYVLKYSCMLVIYLVLFIYFFFYLCECYVIDMILFQTFSTLSLQYLSTVILTAMQYFTVALAIFYLFISAMINIYFDNF